MLVQCPKCKTTYKVSDEVVKGAAPSFRCSRCKHTFEMEPAPENSLDDLNAGQIEAEKNNEPILSFEPERREEKDPSAKDSSIAVESGGDKNPAASSAEETEPREPDVVKEENEPFIPPVTEAHAEAKDLATPAVEEQAYVAPPARPSSDNILAIEPYREQPASVLPFLTLLGLLVVLFAFLVGYQKTHPADAESWVRKIPILGPFIVRNEYLKDGVLLKSVETRYQNLQGNREVVVLTGVATNQNPVMIRNVQLLGLLYDDAGKEIERQTMWIGNAISSQIIRGMTAQDVADLQRLKPLKTFEIPAGDSVPFAIIFLRTGKQVKNAACEVLSAVGDT